MLFIINPISGGKNKDNIPELINKNIDHSKFEVEIIYTERRGHAAELVAQTNFDIYVAVGGDGTLNEIASKLVNSAASMGILPLGSGNGLARHAGINMNVRLAIKQLNEASVSLIDTGTCNGHTFINMSGVGFDAHIGKTFAESKTRGFKTYVVQALTEFKNYKPQKYTISYDEKVVEYEAFLISFANSSQYGNNAFIAPNAEINDGLLDVCVLKPFKMIDIFGIGFRLFNKSIKSSKYMYSFQAKEIIIEREYDGISHLDGEPMFFGKRLQIKVAPKSLKLLIP
jgi:diacylglycerol kinase (ATP)